VKTFPGLEQMRAHIPDMRTRRGSLLVGLYVLTGLALITLVFIFLDARWPEWTLVAQVAIIAAGFVWMARFFWQRQAFKQKWGELAYRNAAGLYVVPGLTMILAAVAHIAYMPGPAIPLNWWTPGLVTLGWYFSIIGFVLWLRAVFTFGFDNLAMLYVYFPEEGRMVDSAIYGILRHPVYAGVIHLGLGLGLLNGNWFALAFGLFMPLGLTIWLRLVEEKELLERFGAGYAEYRKRVPAFWPRPRDAGKFWRFLISGK